MTNFYQIIFIIFLFVVFIDPTNLIFRIKDILFILLMIIGLVSNTKYNKKALFICTLFFTIVLWGFLNSLISSNNLDISYAQSYIKSCLFLLIIIPLWMFDTQFLIKTNAIMGTTISIIVTFTFISSLYPEFFNQLYSFFKNKDNTMIISIRHFGPITMLALFYKTIPICFFSLVYFLRNKTFRFTGLLCLLILLSIILSGSRAPAICGLSLFLISYFSKLKPIKRYSIYLIGFILLCMTAFFFITDKEESSNIVKFGDMESYKKEIIKSPVLGSGVGTLFYSDGRDKVVAYTELTYLEIYRSYGIFIGTFFLALLFFPALGYFYFKNKTIKEFFLAYFFYLIVAGTNPLLFSSTGLYIYALSLVIFFKSTKEDETGYITSNVQQ